MCSIEKELAFIVLKDFGIKPRTRDPNFYTKAYRMSDEDASTLQELCEKYGIKKVSESYPDWIIDYHRKRIIELIEKQFLSKVSLEEELEEVKKLLLSREEKDGDNSAVRVLLYTFLCSIKENTK